MCVRVRGGGDGKRGRGGGGGYERVNDRKRRDAAAMELGGKAMGNVRGRWEVGLGKRRRWRCNDVVVFGWWW